jgi:hypothetical protein
MTIRTGEKYVIETTSQFMNRLDTDWQEMFWSWPESVQGRFLRSTTEIMRDVDDFEPTRLDDIPVEEFEAFADAKLGLNELIQHVLEHRDIEYVHLLDNTVTHHHTIVELHPKEDDES